MESRALAGGGGGWAAPAQEVVEADVQVGGRLTRYLRVGRGRPVLVVADDGRDLLPSDPLLRALAGSFRVVAVSAPQRDAGPWLAGLVEGLGLDGADVVVRGPGAWVEAFVAVYGAAVGRMVVLEGPPGACGLRQLPGYLNGDR